MNKIEILIITITIIYDKVSQIFWMKIYLNSFFYQLMRKEIQNIIIDILFLH